MNRYEYFKPQFGSKKRTAAVYTVMLLVSEGIEAAKAIRVAAWIYDELPEDIERAWSIPEIRDRGVVTATERAIGSFNHTYILQ